MQRGIEISDFKMRDPMWHTLTKDMDMDKDMDKVGWDSSGSYFDTNGTMELDCTKIQQTQLTVPLKLYKIVSLNLLGC